MEDILILENDEIEEGVTDESGYEDNFSFDSDFSVSKSSIAIDELEKKESIDEREQIDKSDNIIFGGNDINNLRSAKSINVNHFDSTSLWSNNSPNNNFNGQNVLLSDSISNYDYIAVRYKGLTSNDAESVNIISVDDFRNSTGLNVRFSTASAYDYVYSRVLTYVDDSTINISDCYVINTAQNSVCIPLEIYGLTYKVGQNIPDNPVIPSVSGNVVNNYYITLSGDNMVSYNLLDKPLNEYTPTESMFAISILLALGVGFAILCRKAVLRWR